MVLFGRRKGTKESVPESVAEMPLDHTTNSYTVPTTLTEKIQPTTPTSQKTKQQHQDDSESTTHNTSLEEDRERLESERNASRQHYSFFSPHVASARKEYLGILIKMMILSIVLMWGFLPLYWGSLATSTAHTHNLRAWVVDHDNSTIGQGVVNAVQASLQTSAIPNLGWIVMPPTDDRVKDQQSVISSILDEQAWVAIVVSEGATSSLLNARSTFNSSYDPTSAITVYYSQARNELASGNYIVPIVTQLLTSASTKLGIQLVTNLNGSDVGTILQRAPQTITNPVAWRMENLRPYTASVATAVTLVGEIYLCIFAFILTMANFNARHLHIQHHLTIKSLILVRLFIPFLLYLPLSLSFATVSLPFKLPFGAKYTYAQGFFLYWVVCYLTMAALGLATEAMITLLCVKFIAYFLLALIISNVSVAALPSELQPAFYRYGKGWPVFNASQAIRTIIFDTKSHLGLNIGVIVAWVMLSVFTITLFTFVMVKKERRSRFVDAS